MAVKAVHGDFSVVVPGKRGFRQSRSAYTEAVELPVRVLTLAETVSGAVTFDVDPNAILDALQPGEKALQLRLWVIGRDREIDVNAPALVAGIEVEVHRRLAFPDEEFLYTRDEMLANQLSLTDPALWEALASLDSLVTVPTIDSVPTRDDDVIKYTVEATAVVTPG